VVDEDLPEGWKRNLLTPKLVAVALGVDAVVVFFIALTAYGLGWLSPGVAFGVGGALFLLALLGAGLVRRRAALAVGIGWLVQLVLVGGGIALLWVDPASAWGLLFLAAASLALWVWCLWRGAKTDRAPFPSTPAGDAA
jgi:hypothetical protein